MSDAASKIARFKRKLEASDEEPKKMPKTSSGKKSNPDPKEQKKSQVVSKENNEKLHFVLPEDDDFVEPAPRAKPALANPLKQIRTYSKAERAKSRKKPEEEDKERREVLKKFKQSASVSKDATPSEAKNSLQKAETSAGMETFAAEKPKLLDDEKHVAVKAVVPLTSKNKGIFGNAKYSRLIQKKGTKESTHKEEDFIEPTERYNPYNLRPKAAQSSNKEKAPRESAEQKVAATDGSGIEATSAKEEKVVEGSVTKAVGETKTINAEQALEYVRKSKSEVHDKIVGPAKTKLRSNVLRLLDVINANVLLESAEVELNATRSCAEASNSILQSINRLTETLTSTSRPVEASPDRLIYRGSVDTYSYDDANQSRSAPSLTGGRRGNSLLFDDPEESNINITWPITALIDEPGLDIEPPIRSAPKELFDPDMFFS